MPEPYWSGDGIDLYLGDCREITAWLDADVLVTDPPYGIGWSRPFIKKSHHKAAHAGIQQDHSTEARDEALRMWGSKPALVFGSLQADYPKGWLRMLVFHKPTVGAGFFGRRLPWLGNWEPIFVLGDWPSETPNRDAVVRTAALCASGYNGYTTLAGHAHAKPVDMLENLIEPCPPGVIADPFAGSGSTLVAAKLQGRRAIGVEIEERYCEIAARRLDQGVLDFGDAS